MNQYVVYTKAGCTYCNRIKSVLKSRGINFQELKLNEDFTREYILEKYPYAKTFPIVVVDGFYIGGYDQLIIKLNEELVNTQKLLNEDM